MIFENSKVEIFFGAYQDNVRRKLLDLRRLIFDTAAQTPGVGMLEETLKWGQPSYLTSTTRSGSTIRIDEVKSTPNQYALYFNCQTNLVETFRELYPEDLVYQNNRAILFEIGRQMPEDVVQHCIGLALTYHLHKNRR